MPKIKREKRDHKCALTNLAYLPDWRDIQGNKAKKAAAASVAPSSLEINKCTKRIGIERVCARASMSTAAAAEKAKVSELVSS
jgi:hypothetical protein